MDTDHHLYKQCDFHIHTRFSPCASAEMRIPDIVRVCSQRGIRNLGITDHINGSTDPKFLLENRRLLQSVNSDARVYLGCEADILDVGKHAASDFVRSTVDYVAVAANHFHSKWVASPESAEPEVVARHFYKTFAYACSLDFVDIIVHPFYVFPETYDPACMELISDERLGEAIIVAKRNEVAVEISPRALRPANNPFLMRFYALCKE